MAGRSKRGKDEAPMGEAPSKKLRSADEEERRASFMSPGGTKLSGLNGLRGSRHGPDKPAELFRKDLISAMKLPDSEPLQPEDYFQISDPWRQEWERGVQVPVNPDTIKVARIRLQGEDVTPDARVVAGNEKLHGAYAFKLPHKFLHATADDTYRKGSHELHETHKLAEQVCRYDLDDIDVAWLQMVNEERELMGVPVIEEWVMEKILEEIEHQCHENMQIMIKTVEGLGIEYDENVVCDVCRSPDSEDNNEMVFCDKCDICVHQACYGVQTIPEGSWLCRTCALGIRPQCVLCPKAGGAMKSTRSGSKWTHVSCALWIPEVSFGCVEKMEPITKISQIPSSRWSLVCSVCRERNGACIQCSVKTCKTAFHVSCAFQHNLEMRTILEDDEEEIQLKAYCQKHTKKRSETEGSTPRKGELLTSPGTPRKEPMTEEEKMELRSHRLKRAAEEFYNCIQVPEVAKTLSLPEEMIDFVYNYWTLKRKSMFDKALLTPKTEEADLLSKQQEDSLVARMKMFVHLRQDLERVRNLCYMVGKREKMRRLLYRMKQEIFYQQVAVMDAEGARLRGNDLKEVVEAHKSTNSIYEKYDDILRTARLQEIQTARLQEIESEQNDVLEETSFVNVQPDLSAKLQSSSRESRTRGSTHLKLEDYASDTPSETKETPAERPSEIDETPTNRPHVRSLARHKSRQVPTITNLTPAMDSVESRESRQPEPKNGISRDRMSHGRINRRHSVPGRVKKTMPPKAKRLSLDPRKNKIDILKEDNSQHRNLRSKPEVKKEITVIHTTENNSKRAFRHKQEDIVITVPDGKERDPTSQQNRSYSSEYKLSRRHNRTRRSSEINGVLPTSQLIVEENIKAKVQDRLHRVSRLRGYTNGLHEQTQRKIDRFFDSQDMGDMKPELKPDSEARPLDPSPTKRLGKEGSIANEKTRTEQTRVRENLFTTFSPRGSLSGYKIPKKTPEKNNENLESEPATTPETRAMRRKIESDLESNASDRIFETVDGEISIRSSRSTTPDRDTGPSLRSARKELDFARVAVQKHLNKKLKQALRKQKTTDETGDGDPIIIVDESDSDGQASDCASDTSGYSLRRTRGMESTDAVSVESGASSGSKQSNRSRVSEQLSRVLNVLHS